VNSISTLKKTGTKVWLDSVDPSLVAKFRSLGITGATSNPIIIANLIKTGMLDERIKTLLSEKRTSDEIAWILTDSLVGQAEEAFVKVYEDTGHDDGFVSFELDPLIEEDKAEEVQKKVARYVELGEKWAKNHPNRMLKVPATEAGIGALEPLAAKGVHLNVTLIFTERQYQAARDAVFRGGFKNGNLNKFKSVYSVFVSRLDVYTAKHCPDLKAGQGMVGIHNAKKIWSANQAFWSKNQTKLNHEMIFASTGVKDPAEDPCKYVKALAGSDIQTNPPETLDALAKDQGLLSAEVKAPSDEKIANDIERHVDWVKLEEVLMAEGVAKFVAPQKELITLIDKMS
jgi:transaldolase